MKNAQLADIYIKIYNKKPLLMDDLVFLSKYDPECFEKTCKNLFYKVPAAKKLTQPDCGEDAEKNQMAEHRTAERESADEAAGKGAAASEATGAGAAGDAAAEEEAAEKEALENREKVNNLLENLKKLDQGESAVQEVRAEKVKELLGNLFMEMLFPHNDTDKYFQFDGEEAGRSFNEKA